MTARGKPKTIEPGIRRMPPSKPFPKGGYQARVNHEGRREEKTFSRLADARRWRDETLTDMRRGLWHDEKLGKTPMGEVAEAWLGTKRTSKKPKTVQGYELIWRAHIEPVFKKRGIGTIKQGEIQAFISILEAKKLQPATVHSIYRVLRSVLVFGAKSGLIRETPWKNVELPRRIDHREMNWLEPKQVDDLAEAIEPPYSALIYFAAYTGLRAGEIAGLQIKHVDFLKGQVHVRKTLSEVSGRLYEDVPKSKYSIRSVPLPTFLKELLAAHLKDRPHEPDDYLFTGSTGRPLRHRDFMRRFFRPAVKKALPPELQGLRFHDLRHTCVAFLVRAKAHPLTIQRHLGHASFQITMDVYGHLFPSLSEELAEDLNRLYEDARMTDGKVARLSS